MDVSPLKPGEVDGFSRLFEDPLEDRPGQCPDVHLPSDRKGNRAQRLPRFVGPGRRVLPNEATVEKHAHQPVRRRRRHAQVSAGIGQPDAARLALPWLLRR
ncbi:MAG: hypothetical protein MK097_00300, partial [Dechloromonas sp.]|nr:hypothetical protein [Dechloromonas sp.]